MQNGLVFAWGDGDEGKLGQGRQESTERPTMVDALLPTAYAEVAKRSENKDQLMRAGAKLIHTRRQEFMVTSSTQPVEGGTLASAAANASRVRSSARAVACGARHTVALTSTSELFTWGSYISPLRLEPAWSFDALLTYQRSSPCGESGCCGQLGHGTRHDEMLPRPIAGWHKKRGLKAHTIAAGSYHTMALITFSRHQPPEVRACACLPAPRSRATQWPHGMLCVCPLAARSRFTVTLHRLCVRRRRAHV